MTGFVERDYLDMVMFWFMEKGFGSYNRTMHFIIFDPVLLKYHGKRGICLYYDQ